jgi:uracil-DNA glycosylase
VLGLDELLNVLSRIRAREKCPEECPLRESKPLIFKPEKPISVMVVTEGPSRETDPRFIASIANHPIFTYLYSIFGGRFKPMGPDSNVYWTHLRKCFLDYSKDAKERRAEGERALRPCIEAWLKEEVRALKPRLVIAVGNRAKRCFGFEEKLEKTVFEGEAEDIFRGIEFAGVTFDLAVVPHPSGLSRLWAGLCERRPNAPKILESIRDRILEAI